jgi:transcriptional regulator with XRE-family HTH domain
MAESSPTLGPTLKSLRDLQDKSLKSIADQAEISPAYLQKLERGDVTTPSPHVLHRLAGVLGTDYLELMRAAGYVVPESQGNSGALAQALSAQNLTADEARALSTFLKMYRKERGG